MPSDRPYELQDRAPDDEPFALDPWMANPAGN